MPKTLHFLMQQYGTTLGKPFFHFFVMGTRCYMLPGATGPALPIPTQGLTPRTPEQFSGSKHRGHIIHSSRAVLLQRFYFKVACPSERHALGRHVASNMKQVLQQEILRHVLAKLNILRSSLKWPLSVLLFFSLSCLNIQLKESHLLLSLFHRRCFLNLQEFLICPPLFSI